MGKEWSRDLNIQGYNILEVQSKECVDGLDLKYEREE